MKKLITLIIVTSLALVMQAQDVTNKLGSSGNFIITDNSDTELLKVESTGILNTTAAMQVAYAEGGVVTLGGSHYIYGCNTSTETVTLPKAATANKGRVYIIKNVAASGTCFLTCHVDDGIDQISTPITLNQNDCYMVVSDGSDYWNVISFYDAP